MGILVSTRIHQQNTDRFCGPACVQMALAALGMDPSQLGQQALFDAIHIQNDEWSSRPDKLRDTLNARWGNAKNLRFRLYRCADKAGLIAVMRRMFEQFGRDGAVAIALTGLSAHWVVVRGFETHPNDPSTIIGFHVRNPLPVIHPMAPEKPHAEDDDCCAGRITCSNCHYMSLANWNSFVGPVKVDGLWKDEYLVICPDRIITGMSDQVIVPPTVDGEAEPGPPTGPILSTEAIEARVQQLIKDNPFVGVDCIDDAITRTTPATPILVEGLNEDDSIDQAGSYYLVPFHDPEGNWGDQDSVPMAMTINAFTGEFEEVIASPNGSLYEPDWISPAGIARQASSNSIDTVRNRTQPDSEFPYVAAWRQSEQTPTRFWPLFVGEQSVISGTPEGVDREAPDDAPTSAVDGGSVERIGTVNATVFMRIDGQVVTELREMHP